MKKIISLPFLLCCFLMQAQTGLWQETNVNKEEVKKSLTEVNLENAYLLNLNEFRTQLAEAPQRSLKEFNRNGVIVKIPNIEGKMKTYQVLEASNFAKELSEKYPSIKSYRGYNVEKPSEIVSISLSSHRAQIVILGEKETTIIEPASKESNTYLVYDKNDISVENKFECLTDTTESFPVESQQTDDQVFRTFKLAVATDYQFTQYYQGVSNTLAGINDLLNIINPVYERDLSINLELIANNDDIIYDTASDPFGSDLNSEVQSVMTSEIGESNYDIGILFTNQVGGGNAGCISCVCDDFSKGSAYAGPSGDPQGFMYAMTIAHEMGHQFGANHTFSRSEGTGVNVEPGSGTTIMSYAGITLQWDVESISSEFFAHSSIEQISNYVQTTNCATETTINNLPPSVDAGSNYVIPTGTAFKLTATGTDPDANDQLTYSWEQDDPNNTVFNSYLYPNPTSTTDPNFRVYNPVNSSERSFPPFEEVLNGSLYSTWNMTSTVGRNLNFVVQVRDNSILGGQTASDEVTVSVAGSAGPFQITSINENQGFPNGSQHTLTWDVNGTNSGSINTSNVKISLSTDGGQTFQVLEQSTANDGQEVIDLPTQNVDKAFVMIEAEGNIFYAVSPSFVVGNQADIVCDTYTEQGPVSIPSNGTPAELTFNVPNAGTIEDLNVNLDISGGSVAGLLAVLIAPNQQDGAVLYSASCTGNSLDVKFDQEGESIVLNCGNFNGQNVEPVGGDLSIFYGTQMQGTWTVLVVNAGGPGGASINSAGIEFCNREINQLSVNDVSSEYDLKLYPNPSNGKVNMQYQSTSGNDIELNVYSIAGKKVYQQTKALNSANTSLDLSSLATGVYLVKMKDGDKELVKKLIIE